MTSPYHAVLVRWTDAASAAGWEDLELVLVKPFDLTVESVGFLIRDTDEFITLALSYSVDPEQVNGTITIPRILVTSIVPLAPQETSPE